MLDTTTLSRTVTVPLRDLSFTGEATTTLYTSLRLMEASHSVLSSDGIDDDVSTRPDSSRLSLGSSPSELSDEEDPPHGSALEEDDFALDDGDGSLTPTDKIDINDEDDIVLGGSSEALFSSDSSDTLSNAPMDMDDRVDEEDEGEEQEERQEDDPVSPSKDQENENSTTDHVQDANEDSPSAGKKPGKKRRNSDAIEQEEWDKRRASKVLNKKEESLLAVATLENGDKEKDPPGSPKTEQENGNDEGNDRDETEKDTPTLPTKEEEQSNAKAHEGTFFCCIYISDQFSNIRTQTMKMAARNMNDGIRKH